MDTDLPDVLVAGLTGRHLLLAAPGVTGVVVGTWLLVAHAIPLWAGLLGLAVVGGLTLLIVTDNPDGLTWDRWLVALIRYRRGPRVDVAADTVAPLPKWAQPGRAERVGRLDLPWGFPDQAGVPLGKDKGGVPLGYARALRLSPLDDSAMDEEGMHQVVSALAAWLNGLDCHAQVLVVARRLQLDDRIEALDAQAAAASVPVLQAIAARRADALREMEASRPQHLEAFVVLRAPDQDGLSERVARVVALLAGVGIEAVALAESAMAELLGRGGGAGGPAGWPGPGEIERVDDDVVRVDGRYATTLRPLAYPATVSPGWLMPVLRAGADVDLGLHVSLEDAAMAMKALRRQHGRMVSTADAQTEGGDLADPHISGAASDAERLHESVGRNETRSFRAGLYVTVWADSEDELAAAVRDVSVKARGVSLELTPVIFAPVEAWIGTRPLALDLVSKSWRVDTEALAMALPVWTREVDSDPGGALAGFHAVSRAPVFVDRFRLDARRSNAHKLSVAPSGRGKSFEIHHEIGSLLLEGVQVRVVDLENEYVRAATMLGGTVVRVGVDSAGINPLELAEAGEPGAVTRQALFVEALVATMLGGVSEAEGAAIARAVMACYTVAGISADPATHDRQPPQLLDLEAALSDAGHTQLADRLEAWTVGSHAGLASGSSTSRPEGDLVVWALGDLPPENDRLQAAAVLLVVHAVWSEIARQDRRRRVVVLDEAWRIWETSAAAGQVLEGLARRLAKGARKYNAGLTNATQDLDEFAGTALGRTILNNSAIRWLPGQEEGALPHVAQTFGLTSAESKFLAGCSRGQGLFLAGRQRCRLEVRATPIEHRLATSDPEELARIDAEEIRAGAERAVGACVGLLAGAEGDPEAAATGVALELLRRQRGERAGGGGLACRHRLVGIEGDWMAGSAEAEVELTWGDGTQSWGELVHVELVRRGPRWLVAELIRVEVS
ncbi:MAG TPA: hypothetical protein VKY26_08575 [Actinomycetota bacterium]|nr:hypothetical protein [Actinomycetota bacterium]